MHGWLNIGTQKEKMGEDPMCLCCGRCNEDSLHLFQCEHTVMQKTFDDQMMKMKESLLDGGTGYARSGHLCHRRFFPSSHSRRFSRREVALRQGTGGKMAVPVLDLLTSR